MKNRFLLLLWSLAVACTFAIAETATAQDFIILSRGGGVTGNTTVFRISAAGEVQKGSGNIEPEFSEMAHLRKSRTRKYFRKTRALLAQPAFNYPGNTFKAIALDEGGKEVKWVWGDGNHTPPAKVQKLYEKIQASLNRLTFRTDLRK